MAAKPKNTSSADARAWDGRPPDPVAELRGELERCLRRIESGKPAKLAPLHSLAVAARDAAPAGSRARIAAGALAACVAPGLAKVLELELSVGARVDETTARFETLLADLEAPQSARDGEPAAPDLPVRGPLQEAVLDVLAAEDGSVPVSAAEIAGKGPCKGKDPKSINRAVAALRENGWADVLETTDAGHLLLPSKRHLLPERWRPQPQSR